jgi:hypothetical protein
VKLADTPDFVQHDSLKPRRDRHSSWPWVTPKLGATYPPTQRTASKLAYLVLLRVEIARFTRNEFPHSDSSLLL